jgi:hypothetical protein
LRSALVGLALLASVGCGGSTPPAAQTASVAPPPAASSAAPAPPPPTPPPPLPPAASASAAPAQPDDAPPPPAAEERFTGRITAIRFGCQVDASCNFTVDGTKTVDFGHDTRGEPPAEWGEVQSLFALHRSGAKLVGRRVEVFAATDDHRSYTLRGKRAYYVHVLRR